MGSRGDRGPDGDEMCALVAVALDPFCRKRRVLDLAGGHVVASYGAAGLHSPKAASPKTHPNAASIPLAPSGSMLDADAAPAQLRDALGWLDANNGAPGERCRPFSICTPWFWARGERHGSRKGTPSVSTTVAAGGVVQFWGSGLSMKDFSSLLECSAPWRPGAKHQLKELRTLTQEEKRLINRQEAPRCAHRAGRSRKAGRASAMPSCAHLSRMAAGCLMACDAAFGIGQRVPGE